MSLLLGVSMLLAFPISAHAEWRQTNGGDWWYSDSRGGWKLGWASIGNNFYYFYPATGIMAKNTTIHTKWGDFSVGADGAMIKPTEKLYIEVVPPMSSVSAFNEDIATGTINHFYDGETELIVPAYINGVKMNKVGDCAFYSSINLINVTITDGITEIGDYVFENCPNLKNVTLPNSIATIGEGITMTGAGITNNHSQITFHVKSEQVKDLLISKGVKESNILIEK